MNSLTFFLNNIPAVVWSGVVGSFITIVGVLISNQSNTKRLMLQLKHDASENAIERSSELRRAVYLDAAEELTKASSHLASLAQIDIVKENLADGLNGLFAVFAKLQLVAEPKTALLVNKLGGAYSELFMKILPKLMPLKNLQSDISINDDFYNQKFAESSKILLKISDFNETSQADIDIFNALKNKLTETQKQAQLYADNRNSAWKSFNNLHLDFLRELLIEMRAIGEMQIPVMIAIRQDLGLTSQLQDFRKQLEMQWNNNLFYFDAMVSSLKEKILDESPD